MIVATVHELRFKARPKEMTAEYVQTAEKFVAYYQGRWEKLFGFAVAEGSGDAARKLGHYIGRVFAACWWKPAPADFTFTLRVSETDAAGWFPDPRIVFGGEYPVPPPAANK